MADVASRPGEQSPGRAVPAWSLVAGGVVSVQFGGALAATVIPTLGPSGTVTLRLGLGMLILLAMVRPNVRRLTRRDVAAVIGFGVVLGVMNLSFYEALARLPMGVGGDHQVVRPPQRVLTNQSALVRAHRIKVPQQGNCAASRRPPPHRAKSVHPSAWSSRTGVVALKGESSVTGTCSGSPYTVADELNTRLRTSCSAISPATFTTAKTLFR